jgi:hypothetical protein
MAPEGQDMPKLRAEPDAPGPAGENQRRHVRRTSRLPATLSLAWGEIPGTIENIGAGGVFFVTDVLEGSVQIGDLGTLRFSSPDGVERGHPADVLRVERYFHEGDLFRAFALRFQDRAGPAGPAG